MHAVIARDFPDLYRSGNYERRSPCTQDYNCIAYVAGDEFHCWWPGYFPRYWWPTQLRRDGTIEAFEDMFALIGYVPSTTTDAETGYSKVALYVNQVGPQHAARQEMGTSFWLSKLGDAHDIAHDTPEDLEGPFYGHVVRTFKRPLNVASAIEIELQYAIGGRREMTRLQA